MFHVNVNTTCTLTINKYMTQHEEEPNTRTIEFIIYLIILYAFLYHYVYSDVHLLCMGFLFPFREPIEIYKIG